jgi:SWI/SNF-related matrix-associated actin-dependent regulator of chromatin subfamily A member 5
MRESRGVTGPHLCIVPKSVTGNWIRELRKWCPVIRAVKMGGTKEERQKFIDNDLPIDPATGRSKFDVLVTSYEGLLKEKGRLSKIPWRYVPDAGRQSCKLRCTYWLSF